MCATASRIPHTHTRRQGAHVPGGATWRRHAPVASCSGRSSLEASRGNVGVKCAQQRPETLAEWAGVVVLLKHAPVRGAGTLDTSPVPLQGPTTLPINSQRPARCPRGARPSPAFLLHQPPRARAGIMQWLRWVSEVDAREPTHRSLAPAVCRVEFQCHMPKADCVRRAVIPPPYLSGRRALTEALTEALTGLTGRDSH